MPPDPLPELLLAEAPALAPPLLPFAEPPVPTPPLLTEPAIPPLPLPPAVPLLPAPPPLVPPFPPPPLPPVAVPVLPAAPPSGVPLPPPVPPVPGFPDPENFSQLRRAAPANNTYSLETPVVGELSLQVWVAQALEVELRAHLPSRVPVSLSERSSTLVAAAVFTRRSTLSTP